MKAHRIIEGFYWSQCVVRILVLVGTYGSRFTSEKKLLGALNALFGGLLISCEIR